MNRVCRDCRNRFQGEHWKTRCKPCYIEMKRAEERAIDLQCAYRAGYADGAANVGLDDGLLRDLVTLCHPDRHPPERFVRANAATARLLALLNRAADRSAA